MASFALTELVSRNIILRQALLIRSSLEKETERKKGLRMGKAEGIKLTVMILFLFSFMMTMILVYNFDMDAHQKLVWLDKDIIFCTNWRITVPCNHSCFNEMNKHLKRNIESTSFKSS